MVDANRTLSEELQRSGDGGCTPLSDTPLLDLLDALVNDRGMVVVAEALRVNYHTMAACWNLGKDGLPHRDPHE